jgi:hypothetical protein
MKSHIEIRHSFKLTFKVNECNISEKLLLCNAIDGYEVLKDVADIMVIDVLSFDEDALNIKVSLKEPLTYKEIDEYILDMVEFVKEQTNYKVDFEPMGIEWDIKKFGTASVLFDQDLLISHPQRRAFLDKLDIGTRTEQRAQSKQKYGLKPGLLYMIKERKADRAFEVFTDQVTHDCPGLCITRASPDSVRENHGLKETPIVWLTNNETDKERCLPPTDIARLHLAVTDFMEKASNGIILLDGLEYLVTNNNFPTVLKLVQLLRDKVMLHNGRLIIPVVPGAMGDKEIGLLEKEMDTLFEDEEC